MAEIVLKRKTYEELLKWKKEYAPEYALFLKGARRVGKTTIAEELGKNEYKSFITINFQSANDTIRDLFVNSLLGQYISLPADCYVFGLIIMINVDSHGTPGKVSHMTVAGCNLISCSQKLLYRLDLGR